MADVCSGVLPEPCGEPRWTKAPGESDHGGKGLGLVDGRDATTNPQDTCIALDPTTFEGRMLVNSSTGNAGFHLSKGSTVAAKNHGRPLLASNLTVLLFCPVIPIEWQVHPLHIPPSCLNHTQQKRTLDYNPLAKMLPLQPTQMNTWTRRVGIQRHP